MAEYLLPFEIRRYLIAQGIVQMPGDAGTLPVCYVMNADGPPQATAAEPVAVHLSQSPGFPKSWRDQDVVFPTLDVTIRALPDEAHQVSAWIAARNIQNALEAKRHVQMGQINVGVCDAWREFGQLYDGEGHLGIRLIGAFSFEVRKSQLSQ